MITKYFKNLTNKFKKTKKSSVIIYLVLRALVILSMVFSIFRKDWNSVVLCLFSLILFLLPMFIQDKFKIELPSLLESMIFIFIFSTEILGEINNFYEAIPHWDTVLHTLNGFLAAGIGFSLIDILNNSIKSINLSPIFVAIVAFCFSMTIGVLWEFFEFGADIIIKTDMQKDTLVKNISTVYINSKKDNNPIKIKNIEATYIKLKNGEIVTIENGYLDIGINDTMKDLFVNFIGAIVFSIIGYLYIKNRDGYKFAENFIPRKIE